MNRLNPKKYIKTTQKTQDYQCTICNYIAETPYHCEGPCKNIFCGDCVKCIKINKDQCPFKCSTPFKLLEGKKAELEYQCPFNPQKCEEHIHSLNSFYGHGDICKFVPENWKQQQENYKKYKCEKGHDLYYLDQEDLYGIYGFSFYQDLTKRMCSLCKEKACCRSMCPQCSSKDDLHLYCPDCRRTPCTKYTCPYEHVLTKKPNFNSSTLLCDFCGTTVALYGPSVYQDILCNFDICEGCYTKLPETHDLVPFKADKNLIKHLQKEHPHPTFHNFVDWNG